MLRFKATHEDSCEIRRFSLEMPTLRSLRAKISSIFQLKSFSLQYMDDEGDLITMDTQQEMELLLALANESNPPHLVRITVVPGSSLSSSDQEGDEEDEDTCVVTHPSPDLKSSCCSATPAPEMVMVESMTALQSHPSNPFAVLELAFGLLVPTFPSSQSFKSDEWSVMPRLCAALAAAVIDPDARHLEFDVARMVMVLKQHYALVHTLACDPDVRSAVKDAVRVFESVPAHHGNDCLALSRMTRALLDSPAITYLMPPDLVCTLRACELAQPAPASSIHSASDASLLSVSTASDSLASCADPLGPSTVTASSTATTIASSGSDINVESTSACSRSSSAFDHCFIPELKSSKEATVVTKVAACVPPAPAPAPFPELASVASLPEFPELNVCTSAPLSSLYPPMPSLAHASPMFMPPLPTMPGAPAFSLPPMPSTSCMSFPSPRAATPSQAPSSQPPSTLPTDPAANGVDDDVSDGELQLLIQLAELGFTDINRNRSLLHRHNNDINAVADALLGL